MAQFVLWYDLSIEMVPKLLSRAWLILAALAASLLLAEPASAGVVTQTFNLTQTVGAGAPGVTGKYGTVTLTQCVTGLGNPCTSGGLTGSVEVKVVLNSGSYFVSTGGPHVGFVWNMTGLPSSKTVSITNLSPSNYSVTDATGAANSEVDFGTYHYAVDCGCGSGASGQITGPLIFDVSIPSGLTIANFFPIAGDTMYFGVDILNGAPGGKTGIVWALPEPTSMLLFGSGLAGAAAFRRRRRKSGVNVKP